jgi:hypothetical protein
MKIQSFADLWGAQAASLQFAAACREHPVVFTLMLTTIHPASCRVVQASSLRSPDRPTSDLRPLITDLRLC